MPTVTELISGRVGDAIANVRAWGELFINVKDHGAIGDGETDDTDAIQKAINRALELNKKALLFPTGEYLVTELQDLDKVLLFGDNASFVTLEEEIKQIGYFISPDELLELLDDIKQVQTNLDEHEEETEQGVHGSTSLPTPNTLIHRDNNGRARVAEPISSQDIARKQEVDTVQNNLNIHKTSADHDGRYYTKIEVGDALVSLQEQIVDVGQGFDEVLNYLSTGKLPPGATDLVFAQDGTQVTASSGIVYI